MKNIKLYIFKTSLSIIILSVFSLSCTKQFKEINTNVNSISHVSKAEMPSLFSQAQQRCVPYVWDYQIAQLLFADSYAQYYANIATYFSTDRLVIDLSYVQAAFDPFYTMMVPQLMAIFENAEEDSPEYALANIIWVTGLHKVTDYWGPIPYFQAGIPNRSVPYDPQDKIYDDFFKRLANAITTLKANTDAKPFGSSDLFYGGDVSKWIKYANTLRLRLAMRISNVDPVRAKAEAEAAVADGVMMTSPDDDALLPKSLTGYDWNGLSTTNGWNEFRMSATMESVMVGYEDPRISIYWSPVGATGDNPNGNGKYEGLRNGLTSAQLGDSKNSGASNSKVGRRWTKPANGGVEDYLVTSQNIMSSAEAYFLRAEGALLGWNMDGNAEELYKTGIKNSMHQWGITDEAIINTYINSTNTPIAPNDYLNSPPVSNIPVKFSPDVAVQREQIGTQKWLALFPDGFEAWADYRRGKNFKLYPVANSNNPDITNTTTQWVRRIPFLLSEKNTNKEAVTNAESLLGGPDKVTTPLWWDKN